MVLLRCNFFSGRPGATMYGSQKSHYPCLKCHENEEKIDNDRVLRIYHRIKTPQPISMHLVSFFLEDNVLFHEIKICHIFEYQNNENRAFRFLGGHVVGFSRRWVHISKAVSVKMKLHKENCGLDLTYLFSTIFIHIYVQILRYWCDNVNCKHSLS